MNSTPGYPKVVSHEEWLTARKAHLVEEKALTKALDALYRKRRELPWERVEKEYVFMGPLGRQTLADLFGHSSQLIIHHLMFAPGDTESCHGCAFQADHTDGPRQHFEHNDVAFAAVSRAPWAELEPFKKRMGWRFHWVSSHGSDFNYDFGVAFTPEQVATGNVGYNYGTAPYALEDLPGMSVFYKDAAGNIFHTYSTYARGLDILLTAHTFLDMTPRGRTNLEGVEDWMRFKDRYDEVPGSPSECGCP